MKLSGHKTRAVFDRYNITSRGDLQTAAALLDQQARPRAAVTLAHSLAHTAPAGRLVIRATLASNCAICWCREAGSTPIVPSSGA
jgi:hypothetical protein